MALCLPNGPLYNDKIINYSTEPNRTVEWIFGVGYDDDIDQVKQIIREVIFTDERILDRDTPKKAFDAHDINIPYPQVDAHIYPTENNGQKNTNSTGSR